jgi:hypothetical protein
LFPGRIFILPHGPLSEKPGDLAWDTLITALDEHFRRQGAVYVQAWPPVVHEDLAGLASFLKAGYQGPALFKSHNFSSTLLAVDLANRTEEELLAGFRKETRRNYHRSLKRGMELRIAQSHEDLRRSYDLIEESARYHGYQPRPYKSLAIAFDRLIKKDRGMLIEAWKDNALAGTIMMLFAGGTASYRGGAMRRSFSQFYPAEFMHVSAMRLAKERGMGVYDLVSWSTEGVAEFKSGFRPRECRWADPRTKVFKPNIAQCLSLVEERLRPLIRRLSRWRANRRSSPAKPKIPVAISR